MSRLIPIHIQREGFEMASQGTMGSNRAAVQLASGDCPDPSASSPTGEPGFDRAAFLRLRAEGHREHAELARQGRTQILTSLDFGPEDFEASAVEWDAGADALEALAQAESRRAELVATCFAIARQATQGV